MQLWRRPRPTQTTAIRSDAWVGCCARRGCGSGWAARRSVTTTGAFKFNTNGYPIQDFYLTKVAKRPDGKFQTEIVEKVFSNAGDRYAKDCPAR